MNAEDCDIFQEDQVGWDFLNRTSGKTDDDDSCFPANAFECRDDEALWKAGGIQKI